MIEGFPRPWKFSIPEQQVIFDALILYVKTHSNNSLAKQLCGEFCRDQYHPIHEELILENK